jgi:endonuclease I
MALTLRLLRRPLALSALLLPLFLLLAAAPPAAQAQQKVSIAEAREQGPGATVTVDGVVTRAFGDFVRFQDQSGATGASGLVVRQTSGDFYDDIQDGPLRPGARLTVTGTISEFNGLLQINEGDLSSYSVDGQGEAPAPQRISLQELQSNGGDYVSELVRVEDLRFTNPGSRFANDQSYEVTDGTATLTFRVQGADETTLAGTPIPADSFTYTGLSSVFNPDYLDEAAYQLIPVRNTDIGAPRVGFSPRYALAYEQGGDADDTLAVRAAGLTSDETLTVTLTVSDEGTARGGELTGAVEQQLTFSGDDPTAKTAALAAADDDEEEGVERLEVALSSSSDFLSGGRFTFWILDDPTAQTTLYAGMEGASLLEQLREDFASSADGAPGPPTLGYDVARDTLYGTIFNQGGGVVRGYYTGLRATLEPGEDPSNAMSDDDVNAEHLWPRSKGAGNEPALSNMHILAPTWAPANSARCNYPYSEITDDQTERWFGADGSSGVEQTNAPPESERDAFSEVVGNDCGNPSPDGVFEPREQVEGNVARKAFYFVMAYPGRASGSFFDEQQATLRRWNDRDPVSATEQRRNVLIASQQGNELNPFQLDSTLARRAFFSDDGGGGDDVLTIAQARGQLNDNVVTVEGIFTRLEGSNARIQDESGATGASGLVVRSDALERDIESGAVEPGDRLRVTGPLDTYVGLRQLNAESDAGSLSYEVIEDGAGLHPAQLVTVSELADNGENYESELVRVASLSIDAGGDDTFSAGGAEGNYGTTGPGGDPITLRIPGSSSFYADEPIPETPRSFRGVAGQFGTDGPDNGYQLLAIRERDLFEGEPGLLAVNEFLAAPDDLDLNGDGASDEGDEFVEIVNTTDDPFVLGGYRISTESGGETYIVPEGVTLEPNRGATVLGDGALAGDEAGGFVDDGMPALPDDGAAIRLTSPTSGVMQSAAYGSEGPGPQQAGVSSARNPNGTGAFALQNTFGVMENESAGQNNVSGAALPVAFAGAPQVAEVEPRAVVLTWRTLSETGNAGFRVQHRREQASGWTTTSSDALVPSKAEGGDSDGGHTYRHRVDGLAPGRYVFRIQQVDRAGGASTGPATTQAVEVGRSEGFALRAAYPNPLRAGGTATLEYSAAASAEVEAALYNSLGRRVRTLRAKSGAIRVEARGLASGLYFVRLSAGDRTATQSVTLVR